MFATPGMLHAGQSLQIFRKWAGNEKNMVRVWPQGSSLELSLPPALGQACCARQGLPCPSAPGRDHGGEAWAGFCPRPPSLPRSAAGLAMGSGSEGQQVGWGHPGRQGGHAGGQQPCSPATGHHAWVLRAGHRGPQDPQRAAQAGDGGAAGGESPPPQRPSGPARADGDGPCVL